ncbi:MAG: hypothetical protein ACI8S6_001098 [Myxococcota bacterium]|jgi:hypothetical protein
MSMSSILLWLMACDRSGADKVPQPNDNFPPVVEIGQLEVISQDQLVDLQGSDGPSWCDDSASVARETVGTREQEEDIALCHYGQLGLADIGTTGGATYTFKGTGGDVCLIVDPETVFWSRSVASQGAREPFVYPDVEEDDGDIDMFAGLSAYYNGSPDVEVGNFTGFYTDSLGNQIEIEYGLCRQVGQNALPNAHAGRGTAEFCTIDTEALEGVEFTVVLETFSVPTDDSVLSFAALALDGACSRVDECTLQGESLELDGSVRDCSTKLEDAFCDEAALPAFCCTNPEMCGEDFDLDTCESSLEEYEVSDVDALAAEFCSGGACCD